MPASRPVTVDSPDGRTIDAVHRGLGTGPVVVVHGGTPSGLASWPLLEELVEQAGLGLVTIARPGYAASTRREGRSVADAADATRCVLDHLELDQFVSLGISGGGPHALADAAELPDRCTGVVIVAGIGPLDALDLDFFDGLGQNQQLLFRTALDDPDALARLAEGFAAMSADLDAATFRASAPDTLPPVDAAAMASPLGEELADHLAATMRSAFSHGPHGLVDDVLAFTKPWGFAVPALACQVTVWHGTADESVPVAHGRWVADHAPQAELRMLDGEGHVSILAELPAIIDSVAALTPPR